MQSVLAAALVAWLAASVSLLLWVSVPNAGISDEVAHTYLFAGVSATAFTWSLGRRNRSAALRRTAASLVAVAPLTEALQSWATSTRTGDLKDLWFDLIGVGIGAATSIGVASAAGRRERAARRLMALGSWTALVVLLAVAIVGQPGSFPASNPRFLDPVASPDEVARPNTSDTQQDLSCGDADHAEPALGYDAATRTVRTIRGERTLAASTDAVRADEVWCLAAARGTFTIAIVASSADETQRGPTRIATSSRGTSVSDVNFHLGQERDELNVRIRTGRGPERSVVEAQVPDVFSDSIQRTVVLRFDRGRVDVFVDAELRSTFFTHSDSLDGWDLKFPFLVGNEMGGDRAFLGEITSVDFYVRALGSAEIISIGT